MRKKRKNILHVLVLAGLSLILLVLIVLIIIAVKKEVDFKNSLPDPALATDMSVYFYENGGCSFNTESGSVVYLSQNAKYQDFLGHCGGNISVMLVPYCTSTQIDMLVEMGKYGNVECFYLADNISSTMEDRLKRVYPDCSVVRAKKNDKFVCGEFVLRLFDVSRESISFTLTHGHNNFLVSLGEEQRLNALKNTEIALAYMSSEALLKASPTVDYFLATDEGFTRESIAENAYEYAIFPKRMTYAFCDGEEIFFDMTFEKTGKLH